MLSIKPAPPSFHSKRWSGARMFMDIQVSAASIVILVALLPGLQVTGLSTEPPIENGGTVVLARKENESSVNIFCRVTNNGSFFDTSWFLSTPGAPRNQIIFGMGQSNFVLIGSSANLTIVSFSRDLNKALLECTNGAGSNSPILEEAFFELRIIGLLNIHY